MFLTPQNYSKGFLIDSEWMGGVAPDIENPDGFVAYVIDIASAQSLGVHKFATLDQALTAINKIPRQWAYESTTGCGGGNCETGNCQAQKNGGGGCPKEKTC
jgi:hypothetical protein